MRLILTLVLFVLIRPLPAFQRPVSEPPSDSFPTGQRIDPAQLNAAINLSADYVKRASRQDGAFVYSVDTETRQVRPVYNIVRHAGVVYALGMFNRAHPDPKVEDVMVQAATFLRTRHISADPRSKTLVVWEQPIPLKSGTELGASGLGLVALAETKRVRPGALSMEDLQSLARFILYLQKPDGSFFTKYDPDRGPYDEPKDRDPFLLWRGHSWFGFPVRVGQLGGMARCCRQSALVFGAEPCDSPEPSVRPLGPGRNGNVSSLLRYRPASRVARSIN
jgi:hypothetical protein